MRYLIISHTQTMASSVKIENNEYFSLTEFTSLLIKLQVITDTKSLLNNSNNHNRVLG